jgi:hypothetical protein
MGSERESGVIRAQKIEIQISRVTYLLIKNFKFSVKKCTFIFFTIIEQILSKTCHKFVNRKSSLGYVTHF